MLGRFHYSFVADYYTVSIDNIIAKLKRHICCISKLFEYVQKIENNISYLFRPMVPSRILYSEVIFVAISTHLFPTAVCMDPRLE